MLYRKYSGRDSARSFLHIFVFLVCISATAFAQEPGATPVAGVHTEAIDPRERIHIGDRIEIDVVGSLDFDWRGTLTPEGYLKDLDKVADQIFARCKSPTELADSVKTAYSKFLRDPVVNVRIIDRSDRPVAYIDGAIRLPMRLRLKRDVKLMEIIAIAGGFTDELSGKITVFRPAGFSCQGGTEMKPETLDIDIKDILAGKPEANPQIYSGDIITVVPAFPIYVIGGVRAPGKIYSREGVTVSRAVASAGGIEKGGVAGPVSIFRRGQGKASVIEADIDAIEKGSAADVPLKANDIVDVPKKGGARSRVPPVIETLESGAKRRVQYRVVD